MQVEISLQGVEPEVQIVNGRAGSGRKDHHSRDHHNHHHNHHHPQRATSPDHRSKKGRKRSTASCCEYEDGDKGLLSVHERRRPRSVGNLLTVNLYDGPYTSQNRNSVGMCCLFNVNNVTVVKQFTLLITRDAIFPPFFF